MQPNVASSANPQTPSQENINRQDLQGNTQGNNIFISNAIQKGALIDLVNFDGETPLYCALKKQHFTTAKLLISLGANINKLIGFGYTLLLLAIDKRDNITAQTIINNECTDTSAQTYVCKLSALHLAIAYDLEDVVDALINIKAPLDLADYMGQTPIYRAISLGKTDISLRLAEAGASLTIQDKAGLTPEAFARACRDYSLANLLEEALIEQRKEKGPN